jgi:hypothetical protein
MKNLFSKTSSFQSSSLIPAILCGVLSVGLATACSSGSTPENSNTTNINRVTSNVAVATNSAPVNSAPVNTKVVNSAANPSGSPVAANSNSATPADPDMPTEAELQNLIKTTLLDFNSAVQSGSFDSFHSSASAYFQQQYTTAQLEQKYGEFIKRKADISSISGKEANVKTSFEDQNGIKVLNITGSYPTNPPVNFELQYIQEDIEWKLSSITVK